MSKQDKAKVGNDVNKGSKDNAAVNRQSAKGYHAYVDGLIEDKDPSTTFTPANESNVDKTVDDVASDESFVESKMGKIAPQFKAGSPDIEKYPEGERHSFEHPNCPEAEVVGQESTGLPTTNKVDKVSDKNKEVY